MEIISIESTNYYSNSYLVSSGEHAVLFDCGVSLERLKDILCDKKLKLKKIILTHGHFDHIMTLDEIREYYSIPAYIHEKDASFLSDSKKNAYSNFFKKEFVTRPADFTFKDGDKISVGNEEITVINTPGHTRGSCCFSFGNNLIVGDLIFANGIGRTDLYSSETSEIYNSFRKLLALPNFDEIEIYSGHGWHTTLKEAMKNNYLI